MLLVSLVTGDVNGRFDSLFARVGKVHTLKGPFHALLCVGSSFLGREGTKALRDYVDGKKQGQTHRAAADQQQEGKHESR